MFSQERTQKGTGELKVEVPLIAPLVLEQIVEVANLMPQEHIAECLFAQSLKVPRLRLEKRQWRWCKLFFWDPCNVLWSNSTFMADFPFLPQYQIAEKFCEQPVNVTGFLSHVFEVPKLFSQTRHFEHTLKPFVDNKGIMIDALWCEETKCIGPKAKDADFWILVWWEAHRVHQEGVLWKVEHVKAHRFKMEKQHAALRTICH